jgi:hypothetical protein
VLQTHQNQSNKIRTTSARLAAHQATLQAMQQSPQYASITRCEWGFIQRCLTYDWQQRPTVEQLFHDKYMLEVKAFVLG